MSEFCARENELYENGIFDIDIADLAARTARSYGKYLLNKTRECILNLIGADYDPKAREQVNYENFKDLVRRALEGDDLGLDVYEVPFENLASEGAWGLWTGRLIKIPKLSDIPKMLGEVYRRLARSYKGKALDKQVQGYIELHEKMEAVTRPLNHELYEATLLKALSDLAGEGNERAREVYEGAMATYRLRMGRGDVFARAVQRYYTWLEHDVREMFGAA